MKKYIVFVFFLKTGCYNEGQTLQMVTDVKMCKVEAVSSEQALAWVDKNGCCCPPIQIKNDRFLAYRSTHCETTVSRAYAWEKDFTVENDRLKVNQVDEFAFPIYQLPLELVYDLMGENEKLLELQKRAIAKHKASI